MKVQMIVSGVGGQGVLFATRIFAEMALAEGYPLIGSETHGMSQRGGSVITHLKIGDFESPLVRKGRADVLFSLEKNEGYKTLSFLRQGTGEQEGGLCFINAPTKQGMDKRITTYLRGRGIEMMVYGADQAAQEAGSVRSANVALVGFACAHPRFPFSTKQLRTTVEKITPSQLKELSIGIFDRGYAEGRRRIGS
jgi:indolepyruvate ferredoxin oxidoreductase beta subunit